MFFTLSFLTDSKSILILLLKTIHFYRCASDFVRFHRSVLYSTRGLPVQVGTKIRNYQSVSYFSGVRLLSIRKFKPNLSGI